MNRDGQICAFDASQSDLGKLWPGSLAIAKSKAYTANAFSTDEMPLSTAHRYTLTLPGHSLWGIVQSIRRGGSAAGLRCMDYKPMPPDSEFPRPHR